MMDKNEKLVKERIDKDLAEHVVTERHAHGLYRHYRCQRPDTFSMGFDIITWPGSLCYTGDMGDYLFQRTENMIAFMRGSCMSYSYAAEKCVAHDGRLMEFSAEAFNEVLANRIGEDPSLFEQAAELRHTGQYENAHDAMQALYDSEMFDGCDMPDCEVFTVHFLWCLHAIKWFCAKLDAGEVVKESPSVPDVMEATT